MKTKIVYCLVSDQEDYYYEQLLISLCSLRKHNPEALVEVVCDNNTYATLHKNRSSIFNYNIYVNPVDVPEDWGKQEQSRYLKTNLRKLTRGNYLYVDTDTIICSSLDFVDDFTFEIAAVKDSHVERVLPKPFRCKYDSEYWIWERAQLANVNITGLLHYNSGVMYVKDTQVADELYTRWFNIYSALLKKGVKADQLSLLLSNFEMNNVISSLPDDLNCQVITALSRDTLHNAKIVHYFPFHERTLLSSHWILDPIKESGKISSSVLHILDDPYSFFTDEPKVVKGDVASLLNTPNLFPAYKYSHKAFNIFMTVLSSYVRLKKNMHMILHSIKHMLRSW